jgi:hypothetical protein
MLVTGKGTTTRDGDDMKGDDKKASSVEIVPLSHNSSRRRLTTRDVSVLRISSTFEGPALLLGNLCNGWRWAFICLKRC